MDKQQDKYKSDNNKSGQEMDPDISFFKLFRFATQSDKILMIFGIICAAANGMAMPFFAYIFGNMTDAFTPTSTPDDVLKNASQQSIWFTVLAGSTFMACWIQQATWMIAGERQAIKYRKEYFKAILNQEIGWFDQQNPNELATKVATESFAVQGAIGEKVPTYIMIVFMCLGGFVIGYTRGWKMSLVITAVLPAIGLSMGLFMYFSKSSTKETSDAYSQAGGRAEQAINAIKTVKSLNGEDFEIKSYSTALVQAWKIAVKNGLSLGFGMGMMFFCIFSDYSLGFWYGSKLVEDNEYTVGDVITVFYSIIIGGFSMGQSAPCVKAFAAGKAAAIKIFDVLDRKPLIDFNPNGIKINNNEFKGQFEFKNVSFSYPAKKDQVVLNKINIVLESNKKTALVGESGSGKSTIMQLLERFYDPIEGVVELDGINLQNLSLKWLRENIGYVGQEPVLFATTIRQNLKYGKEDATEEEMINALKQANAWNFVSNLKKQLDTFVGQGGGQFSGGQKQRICIARAILKNPKILFFDEATSALDRKNEKTIQETLDNVSKGRTTIVIAHRISTVMNADKIIVLDKGNIIEQGTHQELINQGGKYEALAKNQTQLENQQNQRNEIQNDSNKNNNNQQKDNQQIVVNIDKNQNVNKQENEDIEQVEEQDPLIAEKQKKDQEQKKKQEEEQKAKQRQIQEKAVMNRLMSYNSQQKLSFVIGCLAALANGVCFPAIALILSKMITILSYNIHDPRLTQRQRDIILTKFQDERNIYSLGFFIVAIGGLVCYIILTYCFTKVGESVTLRLRVQIYEKILKMPIVWFDQPKNNPGSLVSRLSADAALVNQLTSNVIGLQLQNFSAFVSGMVIAFFYSWEISLVTLGISPLLMISGQLAMKTVTGFSSETDEGYKDSGNLVMEAVTNIRTVSSFGNQNVLMKLLDDKLLKPSDIISKKGHIAGISFGFSQAVMFGTFALIFYLGAIFHKYNGLAPLDMFTALFAIMFSAQGSGNNNHFMVDVGQAKNAAINLFEILDSKDEIQIQDESKSPKLKIPIQGNIQFVNVQFKYPTREKTVFQNLNLDIAKNQKIAFVGPSGCGKSTIMQLLMRFYDVDQGKIIIDDRDIKDYDLKYLREQFGVVSQEPVLFNATIKENILYNSDKKDEDIRLAAQQANALQFIENDQFQTDNKEDQGKGFNRQVGAKGSQISGGQKQRIAIARALLKNPKILLLDEATSALDSQNETIVQESLNQIMKEKTCLSIAHRISTIVDSDVIYVIENGNLVEQGKYQDLINNKGYFYRLEKGEN